MSRFFWICLGGAVGTGARYLLSTWMTKALGTTFPYGTLAVNIVGSFLIAAIMVGSVQAAIASPTIQLALTTGVVGGFTTYSAFSYETMKYSQEGAWEIAAVYVVVTLVSCFAACALGSVVGRWLIR